MSALNAGSSRRTDFLFDLTDDSNAGTNDGQACQPCFCDHQAETLILAREQQHIERGVDIADVPDGREYLRAAVARGQRFAEKGFLTGGARVEGLGGLAFLQVFNAAADLDGVPAWPEGLGGVSSGERAFLGADWADGSDCFPTRTGVLEFFGEWRDADHIIDRKAKRR